MKVKIRIITKVKRIESIEYGPGTWSDNVKVYQAPPDMWIMKVETWRIMKGKKIESIEYGTGICSDNVKVYQASPTIYIRQHNMNKPKSHFLTLETVSGLIFSTI